MEFQSQKKSFHVIDPNTGEYIQKADSTHPQNHLTIAHLIKKIFLVSDNDAYNYLFDFLGKKTIHQELKTRNKAHRYSTQIPIWCR